MKFTFMALGLLLQFCYAEDIKTLIHQGIAFHDEGKYAEAIKLFKTALNIDPVSYNANYELSYTYYAMNLSDSSLKYSEKASQCKTNDGSAAYVQWGTALDNLKKPERAIKVYQEGIQKYPFAHMIYFNLAITFYNQKLLDSALSNITLATNHTKTHPSTYFVFAKLSFEKGNYSEGALGYMYFILLENKSERTEEAKNALMALWRSLVKKKDEMHYNIELPKQSGGDKKGAFMLGVAASIADRMTKLKEDDYTFAYNTIHDAAQMAGEMKFTDCNSFYDALVKSNNSDIFARLVAKQYDKQKGTAWLSANDSLVKHFITWFKSDYLKQDE